MNSSELGARCFRYKKDIEEDENVRALWVGRLLTLKRVDTIIRAVGKCSKSMKIILNIYGGGPEEIKLKKMAAKYGDIINLHPSVPINEVRKLMHMHDVYILSSNAYEGWGAVVSEALEEGMVVLGTYEAGASATILPESNLFHSGDDKQLMRILKDSSFTAIENDWSASKAAEIIKHMG